MLDKYGVGSDPYCDPGSGVLRNLLGIDNALELENAELDISAVAASTIDFIPPPYDLDVLCKIHRVLFSDIYDWAGALRSIDISKANTRFCTARRIKPEADKLFESLKKENWFEDASREELIQKVAELYGDLNVVHPFREGNGRAQRMLFEHIIINVGYTIGWGSITPETWVAANEAAYLCDYDALKIIFDQCIGPPLDQV